MLPAVLWCQLTTRANTEFPFDFAVLWFWSVSLTGSVVLEVAESNWVQWFWRSRV